MNNKKRVGLSEQTFKFIMVGNAATGKSSLLIRYTKNQFNEDYNVTIGTCRIDKGIEFATKRIKIDENYSVKLTIWDTAGQESFKSIVKSFYRNSHAVMLVFNITQRQSFQSLKSWLEQARENSLRTTLYVLIGTHLDMEQNREVSRKEAQQWIQQEGIAFYFQTSSKSDLNVSKAFDEVAKQLFMNGLGKSKLSEPSQSENHKHLQLERKKIQQSSCC